MAKTWGKRGADRRYRATSATYKTDPRCACDGVSWPWAIAIWLGTAGIIGLISVIVE